MAKYVFLNLPTYGHVNPTLALVQELVSRGHEVSYYLTEEFRDIVQATGATFQPYESQMKGQMPTSYSPSNAGPFPIARIWSMLAEGASAIMPQIIDRIRAEEPDAIVYDFMCTWALAAIEILHVPAISTRATYASNEHFSFFEQIGKYMEVTPSGRAFFAKMRARMAEETSSSAQPATSFFSIFSRAELLNIVFIPREFQPAGETFDERYLFVGPPIFSRHQTIPFPFGQLKSQQPLLYISLGSMVTNQLAFYRICFEAFGGQSWQVVLSIGKGTDLAQLGPVPANFLLSPYVPQLEILSRAQVFITHAGTNSVMESMYYGVPMVLIPQQPEQALHAKRTVDLGAGLMLDKESVTATDLRETVERIAQDGSYREAALRMQQVIRAAGGQQRAADAMIHFVETTKLT